MELSISIYVLITPAHNEGLYIEQTIQAVVSQTTKPKVWVIVSDGSTDNTDEIIIKYTNLYSWIKYLRLPIHEDRQFAAKSRAFMRGYKIVKDENFEIIGNLDADITFDKDYFAFLINKFDEIPELGVAGTPFIEGASFYNYKFTNIEHVSGACQLFRRDCFEQIGGYIPIKGGGIDWAAVTTARMKGWKTKTFTEKTCIHHRKIGSSNNNTLMSKFKHGQKDYYLGNHPIWELFRAFYQMNSKPYIIGGIFLYFGYMSKFLSGDGKIVNKDIINFHRTEQMYRLKFIFFKLLRLNKIK